MIGLACVAAYLATSLYGARHIYSHLRARAIDKAATKPGTFGRLPADPVAHFNEMDRPEIVFGSILFALFWPFALVGYGAYRYVTANPAPSQTELAAERDAMAQRIRDLERELDISGR